MATNIVASYMCSLCYCLVTENVCLILFNVSGLKFLRNSNRSWFLICTFYSIDVNLLIFHWHRQIRHFDFAVTIFLRLVWNSNRKFNIWQWQTKTICYAIVPGRVQAPPRSPRISWTRFLRCSGCPIWNCWCATTTFKNICNKLTLKKRFVFQKF